MTGNGNLKKEEKTKAFPVKDHRGTGHPSQRSLLQTASAFLPILPQFPNSSVQIPSVLTDGFFQQEKRTQADDGKQL